MRRVLLYAPLYRDIPVARESWLRQQAPDTAVDLYIPRWNPLPGAGPYPNLDVKSEIARKIAIVGDYDYLWSVEDDIVLPDDALFKLLAVDNAIASGIYRHRPETTFNTTLDVRVSDPQGPQDADDRPIELRDIEGEERVIQCSLLTTGCLLIKKELFPVLEGIMGRDYKISNLMNQKGIKMLCHSGVLCGHVDVFGEIIGVKTHGNLPPYRLFDCSPEPSVPR